MKIKKIRGDLTDISAKKEALVNMHRTYGTPEMGFDCQTERRWQQRVERDLKL